jgi:hypothetical protein
MIPPELPSQIQRMLDGELSAGELTALESELLENEQSRELYRKLSTLHSDLEVMHSGQSTLIKTNIIPFDIVVAKQRKKIFKGAIMAAAAVLIISVLIMHFTQIPEQPIASFRTTPSSDFSLTHDLADDDAPVGQVLAVGSKLHLRNGTLESKFESGVRAVIEAPCILRVLADDRVAVDQGVAWFEVPEEAIGFTVETPELIVVDLGTAFGVDSSPEAGDDEVHVTRGAVEVTARIDGGKSETLREGEARQVTEIGELKAINIDPDHFTTNLPINQGLSLGLVGHWDFENTAYYSRTEDTSGNGHTGILKGGAAVVTDPVRGKVLSLSGLKSRNDMVDIDSVKNIPDLLAHRGLTLAAWIKRNTDASAGGRYAYVICLGASEDNPIMSLGINQSNRRVTGYIEGDGDKDQVEVIGDSAVINGKWTHVAITYDRVNNQAITYVNGVPQSSPTNISRVGDGALDWDFGVIGRTPDHSEGNSRFFGGLIDDVRIYDRPLLPEEIAELAK